MLILAHAVGHLEDGAWDPMPGANSVTIATQRHISAHHANGLKMLIPVVDAVEELPM